MAALEKRLGVQKRPQVSFPLRARVHTGKTGFICPDLTAAWMAERTQLGSHKDTAANPSSASHSLQPWVCHIISLGLRSFIYTMRAGLSYTQLHPVAWNSTCHMISAQ